MKSLREVLGQMNKFSWLHLTDLHFGMTGQSHLWPNVRQAFFDDLKEMHDKTGPWSFVLFTGDFVQRGADDEYKGLSDLLNKLWEKFRVMGSNPVLLPVPGNHDLQRPDPKNPAVRLLTKWNENPEIHEDFWQEKNSDYRKVVEHALANYLDWIMTLPFAQPANLNWGLLPGDFSASFDIAGINFGVIGLNTTFLQLIGGPFEGKLAWDLHQLHSVCGDDPATWISRHHFSILLTHHGPKWLNSHSQEKELAEIAPAGRFLIHLFGHMHSHEVRQEAIGGGPTRRLWQGKALFGLENFGEEKIEIRQHGYSIGTLEFNDGGRKALLRIWPRTASYHEVNGWKLVPDHSAFSLKDDGGTLTEELEVPTIDETDRVTKEFLSSNVCGSSTAGYYGAALSEVSGRQWNWPHDDPLLKEYCEAICIAHSHIRFVEIPYHKDVSDVEIDNLYVEPRFSAQEIHPNIEPFRWPRCIEAIEAIRKHTHLVLLGDPGSGKSTLVSYLSWQLCQPKAAQGNAWVKEFGGLIPLPMILRELRLKADLTWEGLVDAFLEHRIGKLLRTHKTVESLLNDGRAIVLLDGLDEIGNLTIRRKLKDAIHAGITANMKSRWILTSRMVGYDQVPFHIKIENLPSDSPTNAEVVEHSKRTKRVKTTMADLLFLAPFNDEQIHRFSKNWYSQHEKDRDLVQSNAQDFVQAIQENDGTQRLARIPYLLTLMALIHHKNARLPHGRTELYERIATAYLESIDLRRQLDQLPYSLAQKKRWLAEVAYRMQLRRAKKGLEFSQGEILINKTEIKKWLRNAMTESGTRNQKDESETLLNYFAQRSGLLLPRGEGKFAFMHLSLQEYFAACFLEPRLTASRFTAKDQKVEPSDEQLRNWVNSESWLETFVLLFELLSEKSTSETEGFLNHLFKDRLDNDPNRREGTTVELLAELAIDPFVLLTAETRRKMKQQCWRWVFSLREDPNNRTNRSRIDPFSNKVVRSLVRESQGDLQKAWKAASIGRIELRRVDELDLEGCASVSDLTPLRALSALKHLSLNGCTAVSDLTPLSDLKKLTRLSIQGCSNLSNIEALGSLKNLVTLFLGTPTDLTPLAGLKTLKELHLHYADSRETDLSPLAKLSGLLRICTGGGRKQIKIADELRKNPDRILSEGIRELINMQPKHRRGVTALNTVRQI